MAYRTRKIRCEDCGNEDPDKFHRIYVEQARERLVDGEWTLEAAWEYDGGEETRTVCEGCESTAVEERQARDERPSEADEVARLLGESLAPGGPLEPSGLGPERGALKVRAPGGEIFRVQAYREMAASTPSS